MLWLAQVLAAVATQAAAAEASRDARPTPSRLETSAASQTTPQDMASYPTDSPSSSDSSVLTGDAVGAAMMLADDAPRPADETGASAAAPLFARQLQASTTPVSCGAFDCTAGLVHISNATASIGSDAATCCVCPPGTTAAYADESLVLRFAVDGITTAANGSVLRWNAEYPSDLAFTNTRLDEGDLDYSFSMQEAWWNFTEYFPPTVMREGDGQLSGLHFESGDGATFKQTMYANKKIALGARNTAFFVVTPAMNTALWGAMLMFRPGGVPGGASWLMNTGYGCEGGCLAVCAGTVTGYQGPQFQLGVKQIAIFRSDKKFNELGSLTAVQSMAVLEIDGPLHLNFHTDLQVAGLSQYHTPGRAEEIFDYDFRDRDVDGWHSYAAGYMMLGHHSLAYPKGLQFHGVIHGMEIHGTTLSDDAVLDVVRRLSFANSPSGPPVLACVPCSPGRADTDSDPATECEMCVTGRYSDADTATVCQGQCPLGTTTHSPGSTSILDCDTVCPAGWHGSVETDSGAVVCETCAAGRSSTTVGALSSNVCDSCPLHTFAPAGSTACTPSGCTDEWALNFDSSASIDDGSCEYACSVLLANAGYTPADKCLIYTGDVWTAYYSNGTVSFGTNTSGVELNGNAITRPTFVAWDDCSWVIQGKPLRGSTAAARNLPISSSDFARYDLCLGIGGNATVRMVSIVAQATTFGTENGRKAVIIDARADIAGRTSQQQRNTKVAFSQVLYEANVCGSLDGCLMSLDVGIEFLEMTFADNWGTEGAGLHAYMDTQMVVKHSHFTRNTATNNGGGAHIAGNSHFSVEFTVFEDNTARRGGAIFVAGSSEAVVKQSLFARNIAEISGGGIALILSGLELNGCQFESNDAVSLGAALHVDQPPRVKIADTTFNPYLEGAGIVFIGGKLAGCEEHPCAPGYACSYAQYSLQCTKCPELQMSEAGMQCSHCGAGFQPNQNQTGCVPCEGNTYSTSGQCKPCVGTASEDKKQCQICPLNQVADPPELGCRCENGYYNASAGPVLCFRRDQPYHAADTLAPLPTDQNLFCQECPPDCVDCVYPGYAGKPIIKQGYASPASDAGADWFDTLPRVVFECPVDRDACLAEAPPVDNSSTTLMSSHQLCKQGYRGILCTMCNEGYSLRAMGCDECEELTLVSAATAGILFSVAIGGIVHTSRSLNKVGGSKRLRHVISLLPGLVSDVKVFIGLYQVLCSMGPTLEITYPTAVRRFISAIRGFSNFDMFSIPGLACIFGSTVFSKFWVAVSMPPLIVTTFALIYRYKRHLAKQHISDVVMDKVAQTCWEEAQDIVATTRTHEHTEDGWTQQGQIIAKDMDPGKAASIIQSTYKGFAHRKASGDAGDGMPRHHIRKPRHHIRKLMVKRAVSLAIARQNCIGWAFLMVFLVYPSTCANILAVFHCFKVDESTAHITADFRQLCSGSWYNFHFYTALVFSFLYPIGIPVGVGVVIFRHRESIKRGFGPSHFERLYHDYKPDHCLWEMYQLLQKVILVGFLGFFHRGSFAQVVVGLFVTEFVLLAFVKTMPYNNFRTNVLAIGSQSILVLSYFCTILLKLDESVKGPYITQESLAGVMIGINVPLGLYFVYDITAETQEHLADATTSENDQIKYDNPLEKTQQD